MAVVFRTVVPALFTLMVKLRVPVGKPWRTLLASISKPLKVYQRKISILFKELGLKLMFPNVVTVNQAS